MKITKILAITGLALGANAFAFDCGRLATDIKNEVAAKPATVLEVVEREIAAHPDCACEVVKAAVEGSRADAKQVAAIVEIVGSIAPEQLRIASQCAVAVAPDALVEVQAVMSRLDPGSGEVSSSGKGVAYSGKDAKSGKGIVAPESPWNPLDFPGVPEVTIPGNGDVPPVITIPEDTWLNPWLMGGWGGGWGGDVRPS